MKIEVSSNVVSMLLGEAQAADPCECCGILLGTGARIVEARAARNVHDAPEQHFEIDPQALVDAHRAARQGGLQVLGYYHSHPNGLARPSATDRAQAARDGSVWAIITADRITLWRSGDAGFEALPYEVGPR